MIKVFVKRFLLLIGLIITLPLIILSYIESILMGKSCERIFGNCKEFLAAFPTIIGQYMRLGFYWATCTKISPDVALHLGSMIAHRDTVIGNNVVIGCYSIIGHAEIGNNVIMGSRISIISGKYTHGRPGEHEEADETKEEQVKILIGDNSWIGEGALLLASVGANCTVAAGSVVLKDFPDDLTIMGNPARKVSIG
jgi:acyl-[acyl carrier protein]--UDP-N-acetylglucosamine O-acyltransferase